MLFKSLKSLIYYCNLIETQICFLAFRILTRQNLVDYINSHYKATRMVLAAAGGEFSPA